MCSGRKALRTASFPQTHRKNAAKAVLMSVVTVSAFRVACGRFGWALLPVHDERSNLTDFGSMSERIRYKCQLEDTLGTTRKLWLFPAYACSESTLELACRRVSALERKVVSAGSQLTAEANCEIARTLPRPGANVVYNAKAILQHAFLHVYILLSSWTCRLGTALTTGSFVIVPLDVSDSWWLSTHLRLARGAAFLRRQHGSMSKLFAGLSSSCCRQVSGPASVPFLMLR